MAFLSTGRRRDSKNEGGPKRVKALNYPTRRLSQVKEQLGRSSAPSSSDSSFGFHTKGGDLPAGGGGGGLSDGSGSAPGGNGKKVWTKSATRLALSAPLLPLGDSERSSSAIPQDTMTLDNSEHGSNGNSSDHSSAEAQEFRDIALKKGSVAPPGSGSVDERSSRFQSQVSKPRLHRMMIFGTMTVAQKATRLLVRPLASEGRRSVFPTALPMAKRRTYEVDFIKKFEKLAINTNAGDFWSIIDATWISNWVDFVMGNKPPPGPISNYHLYDKQKIMSAARHKAMLVKHAVSTSAVSGVMSSHPDLSIKQGLVIAKDYRVIHPLVWFIFREIYNTDGSPDIFRWKSNLYSAEVTGARKARFVKEVHTKAVVNLRRFSARLEEVIEAEKR